jgi:8-oxo-dGTP diphosphatase
MKTVVAAIIERADRRLLIGQRRRSDTSPLKWEFPGGKVETGEAPEDALARELREELAATVRRCVEVARVRHTYASTTDELEIRFFVVKLDDHQSVVGKTFEQIAWVLPR